MGLAELKKEQDWLLRLLPSFEPCQKITPIEVEKISCYLL
jgi:hypothetical protein